MAPPSGAEKDMGLVWQIDLFSSQRKHALPTIFLSDGSQVDALAHVDKMKLVCISSFVDPPTLERVCLKGLLILRAPR